jgi:hypothetical protein
MSVERLNERWAAMGLDVSPNGGNGASQEVRRGAAGCSSRRSVNGHTQRRAACPSWQCVLRARLHPTSSSPPQTSHAMPPTPSKSTQARAASLVGAKADLALIAILSSGNDYLPSVRGVAMDNHGGGLWRK